MQFKKKRNPFPPLHRSPIGIGTEHISSGCVFLCAFFLVLCAVFAAKRGLKFSMLLAPGINCCVSQSYVPHRRGIRMLWCACVLAPWCQCVWHCVCPCVSFSYLAVLALFLMWLPWQHGRGCAKISFLLAFHFPFALDCWGFPGPDLWKADVRWLLLSPMSTKGVRMALPHHSLTHLPIKPRKYCKNGSKGGDALGPWWSTPFWREVLHQWQLLESIVRWSFFKEPFCVFQIVCLQNPSSSWFCSSSAVFWIY